MYSYLCVSVCIGLGVLGDVYLLGRLSRRWFVSVGVWEHLGDFLGRFLSKKKGGKFKGRLTDGVER